MSAAPSSRVFLDHNATSPLRPQARDAMIDALDRGGNASSIHADGRAARQRVEQARMEIAALTGADPRGIVFTSGASEANALALHPALEVRGRRVTCDVLLASAGEHPSVLHGHRFAQEQVETLPLDTDGRIDLDALDAALARHAAAGRQALVSVMLANNETGILQPVAEVAALAQARGAVVHCDAVQGAGRLPLDMAALGADFLTLSSHKMGGPQGAGALVAGHGDTLVRQPLIAGGGQERGRRAGTENVAALVGFGAAARAARADLVGEAARLSALRDRLEAGIAALVPDAVVLGANVARLPNTACVIFPGIKAETLVIALDLAHLSVSAGSACSSGKVGASHVLKAMGLAEDEARGAIRLSLGWSSTNEDIDAALAAIGRTVPRVRNRPERAA
ncbi:cysteine desulfurase family protein [Roseixanthobacter pseudopolyaromaticivorans]|uniref:cysteine desulfurase family protein n=1 Tax=Xanthobacteraceae TaxID=335928 RepID=UPI00372948DF